jgi:hypothetical protein
MRHKESQEGKQLKRFLRILDNIDEMMLELHGMTCCSEQIGNYFEFPCGFDNELLIATYNRTNHAHIGMEQVDNIFLWQPTRYSLIDKYHET